jgi:hypothetical protein
MVIIGGGSWFFYVWTENSLKRGVVVRERRLKDKNYYSNKKEITF